MQQYLAVAAILNIGHSRGTNYRRPPLDECSPNVNVYIYNITTARDVNVQTTFTLPSTLPFAPTMLKALSFLCFSLIAVVSNAFNHMPGAQY
jgi:hypothetical protein